MKKLLYLAILLCTCLVSCSKEDIYSRQIIGTWDMVKMELNGEVSNPPCFYQYVFSKDGIAKQIVTYSGEAPIEIEFTYSIVSTSTGPKLEMSGDIYTIYSLTSKELVIGISSIVFYCEKH